MTHLRWPDDSAPIHNQIGPYPRTAFATAVETSVVTVFLRQSETWKKVAEFRKSLKILQA